MDEVKAPGPSDAVFAQIPLSRSGVEAVPIEFINDLIKGGVGYWALTPGVFAAEEPGGGFTVVDNSTGDCFTETFASLAGALAYIDGAEAEDAYRIDLAQRTEEGRLAPLPIDRLGFSDEVSENGDYLTFRITADFDTERVFGMRADQIQVDYDMLREEVNDHLMLAQDLEGRSFKRGAYPLDFEQRLALHQKLNDFCAEKFGKGLAAYAEEIDGRGFAVFSRELVQHVEDAYTAGTEIDAGIGRDGVFLECGTFTDYGFGFHAQEGTRTDYVIGWPFDGGWAVLTGSYDLADDDLDCHMPEDYLNGLLRFYGCSALDDLKRAYGDTWRNVLTGIIAKDQEENRFEVPHIFPDTSSAARFCTSLGVPKDRLLPLMKKAQAEFKMCDLFSAPEKALSGLDLDAEAREMRSMTDRITHDLGRSDRGQDAR